MPPLQKITVQCLGTRGDVQPYIALGLALKDAGYDVEVLTCSSHVRFVSEMGMRVVGCFCDLEVEMKKGKLAASMADGDTVTFLGGLDELWLKYAKDHVRDWTAAIEKNKPDLIVVGTGTNVFGFVAERKLGIPILPAFLNVIPQNPKKMIFGLPNLPCGINKWTVRKILMEGMFNGGKKAYSPAFKDVLKYDPFDYFSQEDFCADWWNPPFCTLMAVSPLLAKEIWPDSPAKLDCCGQFAVSAETQVEVAEHAEVEAEQSGFYGGANTVEAVKQFIDKGSKPAYMGWGSMTAKSPEYMVELVANAVKQAGSRAIVFKGWANLDMGVLRKATKDAALIKYAEENLLFVGKTPHDWLFPQCSCLIHHGGSGTLNTACRSGTPQIITPVFLDQWDHAHFIENFGAGVGFRTQLTKVTARQLGDAIKKCETSAEIQAGAKKLGESTRKEQGTKHAVEVIKEFWTNKVETGEYEKHVKRSLEKAEELRTASCCGK